MGAQLESKEFQEFLIKHNIPTAAYDSFTAETENGCKFLETAQSHMYLKADGLALEKAY
jgi:phosphoribosylamine--glycine ligase